MGMAESPFNYFPQTKDSAQYVSLRELLIQNLEKILKLYQQTPNADEDTVRGIMDEFFTKAIQIYLPCTVERKEVKFESIYALSNKVSGKADQIFYINKSNYPLFSVEHKAFTVNLETQYTPGVAQTFAEVMGMCESISNAYKFTPEEFAGILTNGIVWIVVRRYYSNDNYFNQHRPPVFAFDRNSTQPTISETSINEIMDMLVHSFTVAQNLVNSYQRVTNIIPSIGNNNNNDDSHFGKDSSNEKQDSDPDNNNNNNNYNRKSSGTSKKTSKGNKSSSNPSTGKKSNRNYEIGTFATLSDWNLNIHMRNPENMNENRSIERFLFTKEVF